MGRGRGREEEEGRINGEGKKRRVSEVLRRRAAGYCAGAARTASYSMERAVMGGSLGAVGWGFPAISSGF